MCRKINICPYGYAIYTPIKAKLHLMGLHGICASMPDGRGPSTTFHEKQEPSQERPRSS